MKTKTQIAAEITALVTDFLTIKCGATLAEISGDKICFVRSDDSLILNGEHSFCGLFADYYGEFQDEEPYILPEIERYATKNGLELEWETPGTVAIYGPY